MSNDREMSLVEHLSELRDRLLRAVAAVFVAFLPFGYFANDVFAFVSEPFRELFPDGEAMMFAFGFAFEIPVATVLLVWAGITTPASLVEKRPYLVVGCFVIGAVLTPPDVVSQTLLALPMWILFEAGVVASRLLIERPTPTIGAE